MKEILITLAVIFTLIVGTIWIPFFPRVVKTYEEGVIFNWGKIQQETTGEGIYWSNPFATALKKIDMRERVTTVNTSTVSKEGLQFGVTITVRYQVKPGQAITLVSSLQTELSDLINTYANATIDDVATGKDKNEMYSDEGRVAIVKAVKDKLNDELGAYAMVNQVIFENINLPGTITEAIEAQQAELEKIKQKENEKEVAIRQADIRRTEAQGIADANNIIRQSLTKEYLQYEAIQKFNPEAEKVYIPSNSMVPTINY